MVEEERVLEGKGSTCLYVSEIYRQVPCVNYTHAPCWDTRHEQTLFLLILEGGGQALTSLYKLKSQGGGGGQAPSSHPLAPPLSSGSSSSIHANS